MFCHKCGKKCLDDAKFCSSCGAGLSATPLASSATTSSATASSTAEEKGIAEKVFLNSGGVLVSDAVFRTGSGASYPIRNISSVSVEIKSALMILLIAIGLTLFGLLLMLGSSGIGLIFLGVAGLFWYGYLNRSHLLKIGAGGVLQTAIESSDGDHLRSIARAINDAILYIQRGK